MIHNSISYNRNCHWAVGSSYSYILLQLQDEDGTQVRVPLTEDEVENIINTLKNERQRVVKFKNFVINTIKNDEKAS